jgi:HK97 family phage major capsid protein
MKIHELRQERAALSKQANDILAKTEALSPEDEAKFDALMADADKLAANIARMEKAEKMDAEMAAKVDERAQAHGVSADEQKDRDKLEMQAFMAYVRGGMGALNGELREIASKRMGSLDPQASLSIGTGSTGGYTIPQGFYDVLTEALKAYGGMRDVATVIKTESGNALPMPTVNDTGNVGSILSENTQISTQDVAFGQTTLNAYMYTSGLVLVSLQLMQDSAFDLSTYLARALGTRLARIENTHFTIGTGSSQPNGVVTAATSGTVGTTGETTTVIFDDLVNLVHSVDPLYRKGARFMMADSSLKVIRKLKDSQNRPIFMPGYEGMGIPMGDTLLGYPISINQDMPAMAANAKSILFGDFSTYMIRDVLGVQVMRLAERYADYLQVGFLAFNRCDGNLLDAGTHPIKYFANSAT